MSTLEYKWWARKYSKQVILRRTLRKELEHVDLTADERREIEEMIDGLTAQIERRKRDMEAAAAMAGQQRVAS
ncbi:MAG: hypothetical protein JWO56_705 [Acidobacteria bacterium]|nr:hypothetical protein [Acidobacteriota bacterium]